MKRTEPLTREVVEQSIADFTNAAKDVRTFFFAFLSITIYIAVVIAGTTDLQLVRIDPVTLPIVNVGVPIKGFYWLVPLLYWILHAHLLLQFYQLSRRQRVVQEQIADLAADPGPFYRRFVIFQLVQWLRPPEGRDWRERFAYGAIAWLSLAVFPLTILLWAELRFLPFHDEDITWIQRLVILADAMTLWIFLPNALRPSTNDRGPEHQEKSKSLWETTRVSLILLLILTAASLIAWSQDALLLRFTTLAERPFIVGSIGVFLALAAIYLGVWIGLRKRSSSKENSNSRRRPLWLIGLFNSAVLTKAQLQGACLDDANLEGASLPKANLGPWTPRGKEEPRDSAYEQCGSKPGITSLKNTNLAGARLQGAILSRARLSGANLSGAWLQGADLSKALLQGANLSSALLSEANLSQAQLAGTILSRAPLPDANLSEAMLARADLSEAILPYAHLEAALLPHAKLTAALLPGANMRDARLPYADLSRAQLPRADLSLAHLAGANLNWTALQGSSFVYARLPGSTLRDAQLQRANLSKASLQGAVLFSALLHDADLISAALPGATLTAAELQGARLRGAQLQGAELIGTQLDGADFTNAWLAGANLFGASLSVSTSRQREPRRCRSSKVTAAGSDSPPRKPSRCEPHRLGNRLCLPSRNRFGTTYARSAGQGLMEPRMAFGGSRNRNWSVRSVN